jgi:hypothetical protein
MVGIPGRRFPMMNDQRDRLPDDELFVLCTWAVQAVAADLGIDEDDAYVQCDGRWVVVEGRARLTLATREWQTLRHMQRQLDDQEDP